MLIIGCLQRPGGKGAATAGAMHTCGLASAAAAAAAPTSGALLFTAAPTSLALLFTASRVEQHRVDAPESDHPHDAHGALLARIRLEGEPRRLVDQEQHGGCTRGRGGAQGWCRGA